MPNSTLPGDNELGDGEITTGDYQTKINQLATWVNALQAELNALSGTTVQEGAVRSVGNTGTQLRQADSFGSAADVEADQDLQTTDVVQFGRVTDAATPGGGDFDSSDVRTWGSDNYELGGDFDAGSTVKIRRVGDTVTVTSETIPSHDKGFAIFSDGLPTWAGPNSDVECAITASDNWVLIARIDVSDRVVFYYRNWDGSGNDTVSSPNTTITFSYIV